LSYSILNSDLGTVAELPNHEFEEHRACGQSAVAITTYTNAESPTVVTLQ
jgi:hypothetical protein